ncbi:MAG: hypothetical protein DHS20C13_20710 [Thermodesulfobacteriota bacterium]|nr:MAG: hypothetical protein DHS20C13_20710 [Thermodesulfobacteriota bacterium]
MSIEIKQELFIKASPETIYSYLTEQDKAAQWFGDITEIDGRPGGIFKVGANEVVVLGEFIETVPYEKVVFTWGGVEGLEPGASTVEITLKEKDNGTLLTLRHYNIPNQQAADGFGYGWLNYAFPLLSLVSEGRTTDLRCFREDTVLPRD